MAATVVLSVVRISIHAPREGGDAAKHLPAAHADISIHAPREGGDFILFLGGCQSIFQSTPPARGATASRL